MQAEVARTVTALINPPSLRSVSLDAKPPQAARQYAAFAPQRRLKDWLWDCFLEFGTG